MLSDRQSIADEIERLEKELASQHFRALFDRKVEHKKQKHLKKLRKELAELDGTLVVSQPARRTEPKPEPKPKPKPKSAPVAVVAPPKATLKPPSPPAKPVAPAAKKKASVARPAAKKPAAKTPRTIAKKPAKPASGARKKSK
jgi:hypothetical protein